MQHSLSDPSTSPMSSDPVHSLFSSFPPLSMSAQSLALSPPPSSCAPLPVSPVYSSHRVALVEIARVARVPDCRQNHSVRCSRKHSQTIRQPEMRCEEAGYSLLAQVSRPACDSLSRLKTPSRSCGPALRAPGRKQKETF